MAQEYWQEQSGKPLFPNLLWSRPETKSGAGKLLIIGGQAQEFIHVAESFAASETAGAGTVRVLMPESTRKLTKMLPNIEYAASNASGSFAKTALAELLETSQWSDGTMLAGDLGKNSETSLMLESYIEKYSGLLIINGEALQSVTTSAKTLFDRENTIISVNRNELQKLAIDLKLEKPVTSNTSNPALAEILHELTRDYAAHLVVGSDALTWTASNGRVASTPIKKQLSGSIITATVSVWAIQNPSKPYEAITTSVMNFL